MFACNTDFGGTRAASEVHGDRGNSELVAGRAEQVSRPPNTQGTCSAPGSLKSRVWLTRHEAGRRPAGKAVPSPTPPGVGCGQRRRGPLLWTGDGQPGPPLRVAPGSASVLERASFRKRPEVIRDECWSMAPMRPGAATEDEAGGRADRCAGLSHGTSQAETSPDAPQAEALHPLHASLSRGCPGPL